MCAAIYISAQKSPAPVGHAVTCLHAHFIVVKHLWAAYCRTTTNVCGIYLTLKYNARKKRVLVVFHRAS